MVCPYYKERLGGKVIGYCNDNRNGIPSQKHQECLCQSITGMYVDFCPIYTKLKQGNQKQNIFSRIISSGNGNKPNIKSAKSK